ncbi:hypothetical protein HOM13_01510 [Candidatus Woesearchaeota archaeon]|jgi:hypothetical protein|nr:hypothetical protein [Candidatus Woesearchaeota archaeon]MBT5215392.1 hypothetical protein [Candidatus Woesearchaeota archaeon]MBT6402745.1 hypothetical protein [Candidatus Woesearchaeota archaeon]
MKITDRVLNFTGLLTLLVVLGSISTILFVTGGISGLTGFNIINETTGSVNVTVSTTVDVALLASNVNFGTGYVSTTGNTLINSTEPNANPNGFSSPTSFWLRNDGNVYVNLTINSTKTALDLFSTPTPSYQYRLENTSLTKWTNSSCYSAASVDMAFALIAQDLDTGEKTVCPNFSYASAGGFTDEINISILIALNSTVNGTAGDFIQFTARSLGA